MITGFIAKLMLFFCRLISGIQADLRDSEVLQGASIFYANHTSHLDAMVVLSLLPEKIRQKTWIVGSKNYWQATALRRYLSGAVFKTILIDRACEGHSTGAFSAITAMSEVLANQQSIILFPEGTRHMSSEIAPFKGGIYHLARKNPSVRLVPVHLENLNRILPKGERIMIPILGRAVFGKAIGYVDGESKEEFLDRTRASLVSLGQLHGG